MSSIYTTAESLKNQKKSFFSHTHSIKEFVEKKEQEFNSAYEAVDAVRRERAAIVQDLVKVVKQNKIKPSVSLDNCTQEELIKELESIIPKLKLSDRDYVETALIKIKNRDEELARKGEILNAIVIDTSSIRVKEADSKKEVILFGKGKKKDKKDFSNPLPAIIDEDEFYESKEVNKDTEIPSSILNTLGNLEADIDEEPFHDENVLLYTVENGRSFYEIVASVYEDGELWMDVYRYGNNKETLDRKAQEYGILLEILIKSQNFLDGVQLELPRELSAYREIPEKTKVLR